MNSLLQRRKLLLYLGLGAIGAGGAAIVPALRKASTVSTASGSSGSTNPNSTSPSSTLVTASATGNVLPEFQGISAWLNSNPQTIADLKGSVVLIQFWTFACINCQRTLPYVTQWHRQYAAQGLKVIGVHTPEFAFERQLNNVRNALQQHQITYPVPIDNEFRTWNAYQNNFWPHLYLADRQGVMQYDHVGEGAYSETEQTIRRLLG